MEHQPPHPNAENLVRYWTFQKQDAIRALECAIRQLDYFERCVEVNIKAKEQDGSLLATDTV